MAFSYWRTGTYPANQGAQGAQRNNGYNCYGQNGFTGWGRGGWNKWAWTGSCLFARTVAPYILVADRPNYLTRSDDFTVWSQLGGSFTITADNAFDPVGQPTADQVVPSGAGATLYWGSTGAPKAGQTATFRIAMKADSAVTVKLNYNGVTNGANNSLGMTTCNLTTDWQIFTHEKVVGGDDTGLFCMIEAQGATPLYLANAAFAPTAAAGWSDYYTPTLLSEVVSNAYTLNGQTTALRLGKSLALTPGSYAITGTSAALVPARKLIAAPGSYSITGTAVSLRIARKLAEAVGTYSITGQAVGLAKGFKLGAVIGSYTISGQTTALRLARRLAGAVGSYSLSGTATGLRAGRGLVAAPGAYVLSGTAATLTYGATAALHAAVGAYGVTGSSVSLRVARRRALDSGLYLLTGNPIDFLHTSLWNADDHPGSIGFIQDSEPADLVLVPDPALSQLQWE